MNKNTFIEKYALVTLTSPDFLLGTIVMLYTFQKYNPWFTGDFIVIEQELSEQEKKYLNSIFPNIRIKNTNTELLSHIDELCQKRPSLALRKGNFAVFNIFLLQTYQKILYADSDLFFTSSVEALFKRTEHFICCGDRFYYQGKARNRITHLPVEKNEQDALKNNFNGGLLLIDKMYLNRKVFDALTHLLMDEKIWNQIKSQTRNQMILNLYFDNKATIVSAVYNYQMIFQKMPPTIETASLKQAKVVHFSGGNKPWKMNRILSLIETDYAYGKAYQKWYEELFEILPHFHLGISKHLWKVKK